MTREVPDRTGDHHPGGACSCGRDLADAADLGADRAAWPATSGTGILSVAPAKTPSPITMREWDECSPWTLPGSTSETHSGTLDG